LSDARIVICGDLNSFPESSVVNLLSNIEGHVRNESYHHAPKKFDYWYSRIWNDYTERVSSSKLTSAYSYYNQAKSPSAAHPTYTNYTRDFKATLDYIDRI